MTYSNLMSDAVVVPREAVQRLILAADCYGVRFLDSDDMSDEAAELQDATEAMKDRLADSTPVGGWEEPVAWRAKLGRDPERQHWTLCSSDPTGENGWHSVEPLYAAPPPPSVSTDKGSAILPQTEKGS